MIPFFLLSVGALLIDQRTLFLITYVILSYILYLYQSNFLPHSLLTDTLKIRGLKEAELNEN